MTGDESSKDAYARLRLQAESLQKEVAGRKTDDGEKGLLEILNELEVHRIELELQNEELRRTAANLESARDEYSRLYESAPVGFLSLDKEGTIERVNARAVDMLQLPNEYLMGKKFSNLIFLEDLSIYFAGLRTVAESDHKSAKHSLEVRLCGKGDSILHARLEVGSEFDRQGHFSGWQVAVTDITRSKQAEAALRESEDRYAVIFDMSPFAIVLTRMPEDTIIEVNDAFLKLFECTREEVIGKTSVDLEIRSPEEQAQVRMELERQAGVRDLEVTRKTKSGARRNLSISFDWISIGGDKHILTTIQDITARKQAEEAFQTSEERLAMAARGARIGLFEWDMEAGKMLWTDQLERLLGFTTTTTTTTTLSRQYGYHDWAARVHPEDLPQVEAGLRRCRADRTPFESEYRVVWPDGSVHWLAGRGLFLYDAKGKARRLLGVTMEITDRKQAEEALQKSEQRYRLAVDFTHDWEYWLDPRGKFIYSSPSCKRITGYKSAEFLANSGLLRRLIHPQDRAAYEKHVRNAERQQKGAELEWRIRRANGTYRWIAHVCQPVYNDFGEYLGIRGSNRDITDRKRAEEALVKAHAQLEQRVLERTAELRASQQSLARSEERFRQMADNVGEVFWLADGSLRRILYISPAYEKVWGQTCAALYRNPRAWADAVHPEDRERVRSAFFSKRRSKAPLQAEYRIVRPDGAVRWIADHGSQVRNRTGRIYRVAGVASDITPRKEAELALARANRALRAISACNEALLRATSERELFGEICRIIVKAGGYKLAWVGLAEQDRGKTVRLIAHEGVARQYLERPKITWLDAPLGRGPAGTAIRTQKTVILRNLANHPGFAPWRKFASKLGSASAIGLPLLDEGQCFGALTIFASEPGAFDPDEVKLLTQLASNLAFGVTVIRTRQQRRRLEQQILGISEREQRRIGQDLHDGICQRIAAARFICSSLVQRLARDKLQAADIVQVEQELLKTLEETRHIARGLHPVKQDAKSLMRALNELAESLTNAFRIPCRFICRRPVLIDDYAAATHLYRIAQEAANNAARHGSPRHIRISLSEAKGGILLRIADDGRGMPVETKQASGLGLGIMGYRASVIGATFAIGPAREGGTVVSCRWRPFPGGA